MRKALQWLFILFLICVAIVAVGSAAVSAICGEIDSRTRFEDLDKMPGICKIMVGAD